MKNPMTPLEELHNSTEPVVEYRGERLDQFLAEVSEAAKYLPDCRDLKPQQKPVAIRVNRTYLPHNGGIEGGMWGFAFHYEYPDLVNA